MCSTRTCLATISLLFGLLLQNGNCANLESPPPELLSAAKGAPSAAPRTGRPDATPAVKRTLPAAPPASTPAVNVPKSTPLPDEHSGSRLGLRQPAGPSNALIVSLRVMDATMSAGADRRSDTLLTLASRPLYLVFESMEFACPESTPGTLFVEAGIDCPAGALRLAKGQDSLPDSFEHVAAAGVDSLNVQSMTGLVRAISSHRPPVGSIGHVPAVPEPNGTALLLCGVLALMAKRKIVRTRRAT